VCCHGAHGGHPLGADIGVDVGGDLVDDDLGGLVPARCPGGEDLRRSQPRRALPRPSIVDGSSYPNLVVDEAEHGVTQHGAGVCGSPQCVKHSLTGLAVAVDERCCS
jgi:hypothetical protein